MEQVRVLLAIVLSLVVFLLWDYFFNTQQFVEQPGPDKKIQEEQDRVLPYVNTKKALIADSLPAPQNVYKPEPFRTILVTTPLYSVGISEKGAVFEKFELKKYKETVEKDSPFLGMISPEAKNRNIRTGLTEKSVAGLENAIFKARDTDQNVEIDEVPRRISFLWSSPDGVEIEKNYTFYPDTYMIELDIAVKNGSGKIIRDNLFVSVSKYFHEEGGAYGFQGPCALINNELEQIKIKDIEDKNVYSGKIGWLAVQDRYFLSGIIPVKKEQAKIRLFLSEDEVVENQYMQPLNLEYGTQQTFSYNIFFGPKSLEILGKAGHDLNKAVDFGWFDFIAKPCVWLMNWFYKYIPNYGLAIIFLTLLTKIITWPLGNKSYKSMSEMKKIQPLVTRLREQYKDDKKKMNQETMALYKTYKVNPMGGCLPMILQIPIFFALYRMLYEAIELRHAHFFGWINDLSAPDRLFNFGFSIPFMEPPYGIPVLTVIMGGTMFLQQKMAPPMGDPAQAKMMMLMPIIFTVIFINFSSGLVLYWLINNVLSIAQQHYVTKKQA
jgi:YidC/Oxa1 family membrane protein insertase